MVGLLADEALGGAAEVAPGAVGNTVTPGIDPGSSAFLLAVVTPGTSAGSVGVAAPARLEDENFKGPLNSSCRVVLVISTL